MCSGGARLSMSRSYMATCVTCGDELHPERAEKYDYCTKPSCRERNAKPRAVATVGVNKAADQFVLLDEETQEEMASGSYKKEPDARGNPRRRRTRTDPSTRREVPVLAPRSTARPTRPRWSGAQEELALTYRAMGMKPDEIAKKLGITPYLVTQILLTARGTRGTGRR
jgi:hypothetical protein